MAVTEVCKENDSLVYTEVPAGALYGAQTARLVGNFPHQWDEGQLVSD